MDNGFCCFDKKFVMESKERKPNVNVLLCHLLDRINCKYIKIYLVKVVGGSTPCKSGGRFHTL